MLRKGLLNSPLRAVLSRANAQFQSKLDAEIQSAVKSGLDRPSAIYSHLAEKDLISRDEHQMVVVSKLDKLNDRLRNFTATAQTSSSGFFGFFSSSSSKIEVKAADIPGAYLYGNVGTGKTMVMDLFYSTTPVVKKKRVHFNRFMLDIHERIHKLRYSQLGAVETWDKIADDIVEDVHLLCFDEFQVTDIADAMNMKSLFSALFKRGIVIIATSNRHPDDLYLHGLQRQNFLPFIPLLKDQVELVNLDSGKDYRKSEVFDFNYPSWLIKGDSNLHGQIQKIISKFGKNQNPVENYKLTVLGHELRVPKATGSVAEFTFDELCQEGLGVPLGAQDYLALSEKYSAIIVKDVPRIDLYVMNSALRRMITMIDQFYDNNVALLLILDVHLDDLYFSSHSGDRELTMEERMFMDDYQVKGVAEGVKIATLSGSEEAFAIERKISRLAEMSSEKYWAETERIFTESKKLISTGLLFSSFF